MVKRTQREIVSAFNKIIQTTSFDKISIGMLIESAGISKATFYRYFKDKEDVMNYSFSGILDSYSSPTVSHSFIDIFERMFKYAQKHRKLIKKAFPGDSINSLCAFIENYLNRLISNICAQCRCDDEVLSDIEILQCDIFCIGVSRIFCNVILEKYPLSYEDAALAVYELMPEDIKDLWWTQE